MHALYLFSPSLPHSSFSAFIPASLGSLPNEVLTHNILHQTIFSYIIEAKIVDHI